MSSSLVMLASVDRGCCRSIEINVDGLFSSGFNVGCAPLHAIRCSELNRWYISFSSVQASNESPLVCFPLSNLIAVLAWLCTIRIPNQFICYQAAITNPLLSLQPLPLQPLFFVPQYTSYKLDILAIPLIAVFTYQHGVIELISK